MLSRFRGVSLLLATFVASGPLFGKDFKPNSQDIVQVSSFIKTKILRSRIGFFPTIVIYMLGLAFWDEILKQWLCWTVNIRCIVIWAFGVFGSALFARNFLTEQSLWWKQYGSHCARARHILSMSTAALSFVYLPLSLCHLVATRKFIFSCL